MHWQSFYSVPCSHDHKTQTWTCLCRFGPLPLADCVLRTARATINISSKAEFAPLASTTRLVLVPLVGGANVEQLLDWLWFLLSADVNGLLGQLTSWAHRKTPKTNWECVVPREKRILKKKKPTQIMEKIFFGTEISWSRAACLLITAHSSFSLVQSSSSCRIYLEQFFTLQMSSVSDISRGKRLAVFLQYTY